jgi:hypothetical protein
MINGPGAAKIGEALFDHFGGLAGRGHGWMIYRNGGSCRDGWGYNFLLAA